MRVCQSAPVALGVHRCLLDVIGDATMNARFDQKAKFSMGDEWP